MDLDELVERLVRRLRGQGGGPRVDTRAVGPVQVQGDPAQLERLLVNLLENAVRHARVEIAVTVREVPGARAELTVRDDGPGIRREQRERVFERFTRLDAARSADGGAGLGLAIARDIAERHGGTLTISDVGPPGLVVVLALPMTRDVDRQN